jgi:6-pyruvoyltetrahydropterin/6-carboxytetrahydropterin synthase
MPHFHVRISKDDLIFSAAHFITLGEHACEPLHGHNYRVAAEVHGPLDDNHYVIDFSVLRDRLRAIIGELDHAVLLPTGHPAIQVAVGHDEVEVQWEQRRWVFPRSDCRLLPLANMTAELLAQYIGQRLIDDIESSGGRRPERVRIEVEESPGLAAGCEV